MSLLLIEAQFETVRSSPDFILSDRFRPYPLNQFVTCFAEHGP